MDSSFACVDELTFAVTWSCECRLLMFFVLKLLGYILVWNSAVTQHVYMVRSE